MRPKATMSWKRRHNVTYPLMVGAAAAGSGGNMM